MVKNNKQENIYNIPNTLSLIRIILSPILVYLVFQSYNLWTIIFLFAFAALTDAADGYIARHFNQKTELGRKLDMFADRILMMSVVLAILSYMSLHNLLINSMKVQILILMAREIISAPFFIIAIVTGGNVFPNARKLAKLTTVLQGISLPMILLGWPISLLFSIATMITGAISGIYYAQDSFLRKTEFKDIDKK